MTCMNTNCNNDPLSSPNAIVVSIDGDFVCDSHCKKLYETEKKKFYEEVLPNDAKFNNWLVGAE